MLGAPPTLRFTVAGAMSCFSMLCIGCSCYLGRVEGAGAAIVVATVPDSLERVTALGAPAMATVESRSIFAALVCSSVDWSRVPCIVVVDLAEQKMLWGEINPMAWNAAASEVVIATVPPCMVARPHRCFGWTNRELVRLVGR
jgi:hypothetical protein